MKFFKRGGKGGIGTVFLENYFSFEFMLINSNIENFAKALFLRKIFKAEFVV